MKKTAKPVVAGVLTIADGGLKLLALAGLFVAAFFIPVSDMPGLGIGEMLILLFMALLLVLGILAVVGGIYALQRQRYGLALAGSIAAFLPFSLMGLASIILIVLSRDEFE